MDSSDAIEIKLISSPDLIEEIEKEWKANPNQVQILSSGRETDITSHKFGLVEAAAIVAIVQGILYTGELSVKIYRWLNEEHNQNRRIVLQTPLGKWEFVAHSNLTVDEIKDVLKRLGGKGR